MCLRASEYKLKLLGPFLNKDFVGLEFNIRIRVRGPSGCGRLVRASPERFILHAFSYASDLKLSSAVADVSNEYRDGPHCDPRPLLS